MSKNYELEEVCDEVYFNQETPFEISKDRLTDGKRVPCQRRGNKIWNLTSFNGPRESH